MIKIISKLLLAAAILSAGSAIAQNAREGQVKFMKGQQNAIIADYDLPKSVVEDALRERLDKSGLGKAHSKKGFSFYEGVNWNDISADKMDVYFDVNGKGDKSTVTMLVSKGYDNFITTASDAEKVQKVEAFLNSFIKDAKAYQLRQQIAEQEDIVKKAEKVKAGSIDDGNSLQKDKERIEKKLAENKTEQEKTANALDAEKKKLEDLKRQLNG